MPGPGMGDFHRPCNCQLGREPSPPSESPSGGGAAAAAMLLVIGVIVCVIAILI